MSNIKYQMSNECQMSKEYREKNLFCHFDFGFDLSFGFCHLGF